MALAVSELSKHFKLRDLGSTTLLLGIQVKQDRSTGAISLSQEHYINELFERFGMTEAMLKLERSVRSGDPNNGRNEFIGQELNEKEQINCGLM